MFFRLINKKRMAAQNPKNSKNVPCAFWNSHEGCTNSDEKCKFAHKKLATILVVSSVERLLLTMQKIAGL
jgi:hypothetical protein